ncbi:hypothetical protein D9615_001426 [Tricholomella constricta]|uniref:Uncharacterized protein n=1 Tax=Tricholomella constricta TaxID=117010 RepID=A0A8H5HK71_9AGAR|nr:hypothetical protein D9615_001426 [Tricholomella constricta]
MAESTGVFQCSASATGISGSVVPRRSRRASHSESSSIASRSPSIASRSPSPPIAAPYDVRSSPSSSVNSPPICTPNQPSFPLLPAYIPSDSTPILSSPLITSRVSLSDSPNNTPPCPPSSAVHRFFSTFSSSLSQPHLSSLRELGKNPDKLNGSSRSAAARSGMAAMCAALTGFTACWIV